MCTFKMAYNNVHLIWFFLKKKILRELQQVNRWQTQIHQIKEEVLLPLLSSWKFILYEILKKVLQTFLGSIFVSDLFLWVWKSNIASSFTSEFQKKDEIMENT